MRLAERNLGIATVAEEAFAINREGRALGLIQAAEMAREDATDRMTEDEARPALTSLAFRLLRAAREVDPDAELPDWAKETNE